MTFKENFQSIITATADNAIYADIKRMYKEQIIDNKMFKELMLSFQHEAFSNALDYAKDMEVANKSVTIDDGNGGTKDVTLQEVKILAELDRLAKIDRGDGVKVTVTEAQIYTEIERTKLIKQQTEGFWDNRLIHFVETIGGLVGEIQGGGNETPQSVWNAYFSGLKAMAVVANEHPDLTVANQITVGNAPTAK